MIFLYRILINLVIILSPLIVLFRIIKKKEDPKRFTEKFCLFSKKRKTGKLIWFHVSSVGELLSIVPLIEKIEQKKKFKQILVTTSTLSSSNIFKKFKFKKTVHQFFPIDSNFLTQRFINYWNPSCAIFVESEIWPNMILNIKRKSIPLILLNARITKKTFKKWKSISIFAKKLFENFDYAFPQNYETKKYLRFLGIKNIKLLGNLKFSETKIKQDLSINSRLKKFFKNKTIWCASSTHEGEEKLSANIHIKLKKKHKNLLTILIPRHTNRAVKINTELEEMGLRVHTHSSTKKINNDTDIYLVDTYGDTKTFFKLSKIVFLGGSVVKHGGQNPLEAVRLGCKIIYGPYINNFREIYHLLDKKNYLPSLMVPSKCLCCLIVYLKLILIVVK